MGDLLLVLLVLFGLSLFIAWCRVIPKPDIDKSHLITTRSTRGGFTLRTIRNAFVAMFMIAIVISAYVDSSNEGNNNRASMIGAFITWLTIVSSMRLLRLEEQPYQLQWGERVVTPNLWRVLERWGERITLVIMTAHALAVLF